MKQWVAAAAFCVVAGAAAAGCSAPSDRTDPPPAGSEPVVAKPAFYVDADRVLGAWGNDPAKANWRPCMGTPEAPLGVCSGFVDHPGLVVLGKRQEKPQPAHEADKHTKTSHVWYVIDGDATFMTGGTFVPGKEDPEKGQLRGGEARRLRKGNIIVVPAGTPHWWKEIHTTIAMYQVQLELAKPLPPQPIVIDSQTVDAAWALDESKAKWEPCGGTPEVPLGDCPPPFSSQPGLIVRVMRRDKANDPERHRLTSHVWYVIDGEATFVSGGRYLPDKSQEEGEDERGGHIEGGETVRLRKGSVIVIPAGTPHWWKEVHAPVAMYQVNLEVANPVIGDNAD